VTFLSIPTCPQGMDGLSSFVFVKVVYEALDYLKSQRLEALASTSELSFLSHQEPGCYTAPGFSNLGGLALETPQAKPCAAAAISFECFVFSL